MTVRPLPPEEYDRLLGLPIATNGLPDPSRGLVVVAEDADGAIIGTWGLVDVPVLEGLWVDEAHRGHSSAAGRMWHLMKAILLASGLPQALTLTQTPDVQALAEHAGFRPLDGTLNALDLTGDI